MELSIMPLLTKDNPYSYTPVWWTSAGPLHAHVPQSPLPQQNGQFLRNSNISQANKNETVEENKIFEAHIDVAHFKPTEISVKLNPDNSVTIEGKHEDRADEHGVVSRYFMRKFKVPKEYDAQKLESKLSSDGVLIVTSPRKVVNASSFTPIPVQIVRDNSN